MEFDSVNETLDNYFDKDTRTRRRIRGRAATSKYAQRPEMSAATESEAAAPDVSTDASLQCSPRPNIGTAKYFPPKIPVLAHSRDKWREKTVERWLCLGDEKQPGRNWFFLEQPGKYKKDTEVVPLQRTVENPQQSIQAELWCRSLRTNNLDLDKFAKYNTSLATATVSTMFDHHGYGWSGKTTAGARHPRPGGTGPHVKEWIERPVSVGRYGLEHMGGTRYVMNRSPRECIPNSMQKARPRRADLSMGS